MAHGNDPSRPRELARGNISRKPSSSQKAKPMIVGAGEVGARGQRVGALVAEQPLGIGQHALLKADRVLGRSSFGAELGVVSLVEVRGYHDPVFRTNSLRHRNGRQKPSGRHRPLLLPDREPEASARSWAAPPH